MTISRCKCGEMAFYGKAPMMCIKCAKCGTTFGGGEPQFHEWHTFYSLETGKPYQRCRRCRQNLEMPKPTYAEMEAENVRLRALLEPAEEACKVLSEYMRSGEFFDPETSKAVREWQALKGGEG